VFFYKQGDLAKI